MWHPKLKRGDTPIHEQLIEALAHDVAAGTLPAGAQLPPQRDLAYELKIGVGTVTKVYAEARRRGLLTAHVGRGSFIAAPTTMEESDQPIDFLHNVVSHAAPRVRLDAALQALRKRADIADHVGYAPPSGWPAHRKAGAKFLRDFVGFEANWERLIVCQGGQHAMALVFSTLCRAGDTVMTEAATFAGMKTLAEQLALRLHGVKMDEQGLMPDALDRAASAGAKILYTIPTLQNPTGRLMSAKRRAEIAAIARRRDLTIVEDDIYAPFIPDQQRPQPLSSFAAERSYHLSSLSKLIAPGLRCGYMLTPDADAFERIVRSVRALSYSPPSFGPLIGTQWIEDGGANEIAASARRTVAERVTIARRILGKAMEGPHAPVAPHIWLPMSDLDAERVAGRALRQGVAVTPPSVPIVDSSEMSGLRLCLGAPGDAAALERGLKIVRRALTDGQNETLSAVV
ncbi:MAG: aminotransferase class I/II-fold pyridoxal phosphate-dependent enzyme [Alphaproteobacteria bacterium]|nr:aminotransferase class I/II-fold pyridoxal phosphate-dependent enzyme [Alphaproteobacteria bacterium]